MPSRRSSQPTTTRSHSQAHACPGAAPACCPRAMLTGRPGTHKRPRGQRGGCRRLLCVKQPGGFCLVFTNTQAKVVSLFPPSLALGRTDGDLPVIYASSGEPFPFHISCSDPSATVGRGHSPHFISDPALCRRYLLLPSSSASLASPCPHSTASCLPSLHFHPFFPYPQQWGAGVPAQRQE